MHRPLTDAQLFLPVTTAEAFYLMITLPSDLGEMSVNPRVLMKLENVQTKLCLCYFQVTLSRFTSASASPMLMSSMYADAWSTSVAAEFS